MVKIIKKRQGDKIAEEEAASLSVQTSVLKDGGQKPRKPLRIGLIKEVRMS